ncbi:MAG TPA: UDP-N-acetylmuramoyl-L-alanine--D-glutamate ligase [Hyphomicrobiaceae bacterium]|jgi:UDP-N-acetylmuramoylalanine--D-glutamate ligase
MIRVTTFAGKTVALVGLGASGRATANALLAGGAEVAAWDDNAEARTAASQAGIPVADLSAMDWRGFAALVLAPGIPLTHPEPHWAVARARAAGVEIIGDIELFCRERASRSPDAPFVAITGTNGKSTTTALLAHLLRAAGRDVAMGGNIGTPILALPEPASGRVHVIEMSSFQIDLTPSLAPTVGVLLNLTPDHLDRHGTMEHYAAIKERLVTASCHPIIGVDDDYCQRIADRLRTARNGDLDALSVLRPLPGGWFADGSRLHSDADWAGISAVFADLNGIGTLRGRHNAQNALAACIAALRLGVLPDQLQPALATFPGLPHRMEEVGRAGRVLFINDSKATNADSTEKALAAFPRDIYWIVGGRPKEGGIEPLRPYFPRIAKAYLIGESTESFAATLGAGVPFERSGTLDIAVRTAAREAAQSAGAEPVVLLSPACASYDQFKNFEQRGNVFRELVAALPGVTVPGRP